MKKAGTSKTQAKVSFIFLSIAVALMLVGLPKPVKALEQTKLYGQVTDTNGQPIADCYIDVSDDKFVNLKNTYTDEKGYYELGVPKQSFYHIWAGKTNEYDFLYIPQDIAATPGKIDFRLVPGANIVINAYDEQGNILRNQAFRQNTGSKVFATDTDNLPGCGYFCAIHDEKSNWDWNQAIPAFIVLPQSAYKIHVNWEVPGFGKVMVTANNEGNGYRASKQGERITLNLNYELAKSTLALLKKDADATMADDVAASEKHLKTAESYLNQNSSDMKAAVKELNLSLKYSLMAREQLVLVRAAADIEKYRRGDVQLQIVGADGKALSNCEIEYQQVSHDFLFGANPLGKNGSYDAGIANLMKGAGINHSYVTPRWGIIEPEAGAFCWENIDSYQRIDKQLKQGFELMGSLSLWLTENSDFTPCYLKNMSFEELKRNVHDYGYALANKYKGKIDTWEINEMNLASANALNLTWGQKIELSRVFAAAIKEANPESRILNGSTALPYEFIDSASLPQMLHDGAPADIIGLELYYSGVNTDGYPALGLDMASISDLLDSYSIFGKPIYVKELSAPSSQVTGSSWWHKPWDEQIQAEYLEKVYTVAFSKPSVQAITWSWGIADEDAFIVSGGLLDTTAKPKPAYSTLKTLISSWTTGGSGITNSSGQYDFRGFGGDYMITVKTSNRQSFSTVIHVAEQATGSIQIHAN